MQESIYNFKVKDLQNKEFDFKKYEGKPLLIVNVASKCGFTPQYKGLEALYRQYKDQGFEIIGFPCNQFGAQEPGTNSEIQSFCSLTYDVTFPIMSKIDVNGSNTAPIYQFLKKKAPGIFGTKNIKWNFTKFLVNKDGTTVKRFAPKVEPKDIEDDIKKALS